MEGKWVREDCFMKIGIFWNWVLTVNRRPVGKRKCV